MRKTGIFTFIVLALTLAAPLYAAPKERKPICRVMTEADLYKIDHVPHKAEEEAVYQMHRLWAHALYATNDNAIMGDCKGRELLDDDLFGPMMAASLMSGGPNLNYEARVIFAHYMPQFRKHVATLKNLGVINALSAGELDSMAAKLQ